LVMAESHKVVSVKKGLKPRRVGYLKMQIIEDLKKETINQIVKDLVSEKSSLDTYG